jgi:hypothetical protein
MPRVQLPQLLRPLAEGMSSVEIEGETLRFIIEALEKRYRDGKRAVTAASQKLL